MGVENNNDKSENNNKYTLLKELNTPMVYDVKELNSEEKDFKLYSILLDFFQNIKIFEQTDYIRGDTRKQASNIYQNILQDINLEKLVSFNISKGILVLNYENGEKEYKNLIFSEEKGEEYITELKNTGDATIDNLSKLDNGLNNERILGGAIVITYGVSSEVGNHFLDKVVIKLSNGLTKMLTLTEGGINSGTKDEIKSNLFKILEKEGILFDSNTLSFYKIEDSKISTNLKKEIRKITYEKYKEICESNGEKASEKIDFELNKQKISAELNKTEFKISSIKEAQALVGRYGFGPAVQHAIFIPVFLKTYYSQTTDLASLGKSLSEWGLFELGAKTGLKTAKALPIKNPLLMVGTATVLSLGLGVGSIFAGKEIGEKIELDKKFWKACPEREDYWEKKGWGGKSFLTHAITFGTVNDLVDKLGFDIKIPFTPISFIETSVDIDTDMMSYMSSAVGRDKEFWNKRVGEYSDNITEDIIGLLDKYKKVEYLPNDEYYGIEQKKNKKSPESKLSELKNSLISLLKIGTGKNENVKNEIFVGILGLIKSGNFNINKETINFIVSNNLSKLKLDDYSKKERKNSLALQDFKIKTFLGLNVDITSDLVAQKRIFELENPLKGLNEEEIAFSRKIYKRIVNHERMIDSDITLGIRSLNNHKLTKNQYISPSGYGIMEKSKDKILFEKLIENANFLHFLNTMVEYKRDKDFLTNINKSGYAVEWRGI